tara:strand:+ start:351 stop:878 length:528 start_codon:yes stop_codon:yes gene_type:complete
MKLKLFLASIALCFTAPLYTSTVKTGPAVNIKRYSGTWYEIASFPTFFQRNCFCTTATYSVKSSYLGVFNECRKDSPDGEVSSIHGKAFVVPNSRNTKLKVQFFWPFKADYWILYHDPKYQYAVVGNPSREYLWILARNPRISARAWRELTAIANKQGFDIKQLNRTTQSCYEKK